MPRSRWFPLAFLAAVACTRSPAVSDKPLPPTLDAAVSAAIDAGPSEAGTPAAPAAPGAPLGPDALAVAAGVNGLGFDLYARARASKGNLVFSPASIGFAFGMVYGGAGGTTAQELARTMYLADVAPDVVHQGFAGLLARAGSYPGTKLRIANRLWAQRGVAFAPAFLGLTRERYAAPAELADFATVAAAETTRQAINGWVATTTNDRIRDLLPPGSIDGAVMVLVNAIWFQGRWQEQFKSEATRDAAFTLQSGAQVQVKTMHRKGAARLGYVDDVELLELDYAGSDLSMVIALSRAPAGLDGLEKRLTTAAVSAWLAQLSEVAKLEIALPRFEIKQDLPLTEYLGKLGLARLFSPGEADLSGMLASGKKDLYVSDAFHQAFVSVNEEGAEAAAATAVVVQPRSMPIARAFRADRPFVWMIRDKQSGLVLFLGRVVDPRQGI